MKLAEKSCPVTICARKAWPHVEVQGGQDGVLHTSAPQPCPDHCSLSRRAGQTLGEGSVKLGKEQTCFTHRPLLMHPSAPGLGGGVRSQST